MKRPYFVHFIAIQTKDSISVRASLTLAGKKLFRVFENSLEDDRVSSSPLDSISLLSKQNFRIKVVGFFKRKQESFQKNYDSDSFGNFYFKIPLGAKREGKVVLQVYETSTFPGLELEIGTFIPLLISKDDKLIISDFDKTLVDTRYSTTKEIYKSITKPLNAFPSITESIDIFKSYSNQGYRPFILTASPHFYENAIRDWLYQNGIFSAGIFLKDYRNLFSFTEGNLSFKDLKDQGFYKLNNLVTILLMCGIPKELVLMGDGFEADTLIYLTLSLLLTKSSDPWHIWNTIKGHQSFKFRPKQNSQFLSKIYQLKTMLAQTDHDVDIKIFIRTDEKKRQVKINLPMIQEKSDLVEYYSA